MCRLLKGFSTAVSAIVHVTPQFDEPYCSTVPECEFQILYGRQLIRFRAQTPQEKADWIAALGGAQPPCPPAHRSQMPLRLFGRRWRLTWRCLLRRREIR